MARIAFKDPEYINGDFHPGFPVDVFHFENKHSELHEFCQNECNPHHFPELRGQGDQEWFFNTSIAEQTNVWLGGFSSVVREMRVEKYEFFLDQMILMRNALLKRRLARNGLQPMYWTDVE